MKRVRSHRGRDRNLFADSVNNSMGHPFTKILYIEHFALDLLQFGERLISTVMQIGQP